MDTVEGHVDATDAVVALGPWAPDVLKPLGIDLPLAVKRGYHRHFKTQGNKGLNRPVLDAEVGYLVAPMEQGLRLTTGAEFADRDAGPTPVQFDRLMPEARALFPLGERADDKTWLGRRPCFPDSMPVVGRAPGQKNLWLDYGHAHWGLTLGPATGRLLAEHDDGENAVHRPEAVSGRPLHLVMGIAVADLEIEELSARRGREKRLVNARRHILVNVAPPGDERDRQAA